MDFSFSITVKLLLFFRSKMAWADHTRSFSDCIAIIKAYEVGISYNRPVQPRLSKPSIIQTPVPKKLQGQSTKWEYVVYLHMRHGHCCAPAIHEQWPSELALAQKNVSKWLPIERIIEMLGKCCLGGVNGSNSEFQLSELFAYSNP